MAGLEYDAMDIVLEKINRVDFDLSNIDLALANSLHTILAEIPTVAVDTVEVEANASVLADE